MANELNGDVRVKYERATREHLQRMNWYRFVKPHPKMKQSPPMAALPIEPPIFIPVQEAARAFFIGDKDQ